MQNDANCNPCATASVYRNGLRTSAAIYTAPADGAHALPGNVIFCEGALTGMLSAIYAAESGDSAAHSAELSSAWYRPDGLTAAPEGFTITAAQRGDKGVIRGIYALSAQSVDCFVRKFRAGWDALWQAWADSGMKAWLIARQDGRACAYAVTGRSSPEADMDDVLYEFCALPDCGLNAEAALALAIASGKAASGARIHVSQLHFRE